MVIIKSCLWDDVTILDSWDVIYIDHGVPTVDLTYTGVTTREDVASDWTFFNLSLNSVLFEVWSNLYSKVCSIIYRLITAYLILQVNLDKIMHAR